MSILSKYYELLTEIVIANNEKVTIDPDTPYTMVYLSNDRDCAQCTGIIRGIIGEEDTIAVISLNMENMNFANVINTRSIVRISPYSFNAHFEDSFNNWIGVEVAEKSRIDIRLRYVNSEAIVPVEQGSLYKITYVTRKDGSNILTTGTGKVTGIIRSTTKESMPEHINHFTNDIDYIILVDFGDKNASNREAINVIDIRQISLVLEDLIVDTTELQRLIISVTTQYINLSAFYTEASMSVLKDIVNKANYDIVANALTTSDKVNKYIKDITKAIEDLKEVKDEYDLITYDIESNTLYCNESGYQVVVGGEDGCNKNTIKYFTNFGTERSIIVPDGLTVIWGRSDREERVEVKGFKGYIKEPMNIIFKNANLKDVYLGYKIDEDESGDIKYRNIVAKFDTCEIGTLYAGGTSENYASDHNRVLVLGGHIGTIYTGGNSPKAIEREHAGCCMQLVNVFADNVYLGGINENTTGADIEITSCVIKNLFCSGTEQSICDKNYVNVDKSEFENIVYLSGGLTVIRTIIVILNNSTVKVVTMGGVDPDWGVFDPGESDDPNLMYLLINSNTNIDTLLLGNANGEKVHKEYVKIDYPKFTVTNDIDDLIQ